MLSQDYLKRKQDVLAKLVNYWRSEAFYKPAKVFKLALVISRSDSLMGIGNNAGGS